MDPTDIARWHDDGGLCPDEDEDLDLHEQHDFNERWRHNL